MPVTELVVEGKLDGVLLGAVLKGNPTVNPGGSKTGLRSRVEAERRARATTICYIRDRDFDHDPPDDRARPEVHARDAAGQVLGWYWCRHEIESYLLEPAIVARAMGCDEGDYRSALVVAARRIRDYQAARGAIGFIRRSLPPNYKFQTLPADIRSDSFCLPADLSVEAVSAWAKEQAVRFRDQICPQLAADAVEQVIEQRRALLSEEKLGATDEILLWLSGKDLMAALGPWLAGQRVKNPGAFRTHLRDWVTEHPADTVSFLPEWGNFIALLHQLPSKRA